MWSEMADDDPEVAAPKQKEKPKHRSKKKAAASRSGVSGRAGLVPGFLGSLRAAHPVAAGLLLYPGAGGPSGFHTQPGAEELDCGFV